MDDRRDSPQLIRMWRIYRTTKDMCYDRGYQITPEECKISLDEFRARFGREDGGVDRERMSFTVLPTDEMIKKHSDIPTAKNPNPTAQCGSLWVEFDADENVGLKRLRDFLQQLMEKNNYGGILICPKPMTGMALRLLKSASGGMDEGPKGGVECFTESDLLVNITRHELVPKHVLLSKEEKKQLLDRYRLKETQLPRIQVTDPVAKYLGLKRGQVVKIIRKSETAGRYASYRWAI